MSTDQATKFPQTNASLQVQRLETVEYILSQSTSADTSTHGQLERIFRAIETAMQSQESYIANQNSEIAGLHARIDELNEHIVKTAMMPVYTHANETEKSLISDPDIFKGDEQDIKKSQELFDTFTAQVQLKMIGDKDCFSAEKERIIYVASRISGPAYKNIRCWVTPVLEDKEGGFKSWQEIPEVLRHIYGVADKHAAAEREMAFLQQNNLPFIQFLAQFNALLADLSWGNRAKVSALKARINYELSEALVPVIHTPEHEDFDGWVKLLVKLAENVEVHAQRKRSHFIHTANHRQNRLRDDYETTQTKTLEPMHLDTIRLHPAERARRFRSNLCMYCGQPGHFKSQCAEAIATRGRNPGSSNYREVQVYREGLKDQSSA